MSDEDWHYTLPTLTGGSGTVIANWPFLSNEEGWVGASGAGITSSWDGTDGDPAVGCLKSENAGTDFSYGTYRQSTSTWEDLGVPCGATVTTVAASIRFKKVFDEDKCGISMQVFYTSIPNHQYLIDVFDSDTLSVGVWTTKTGSVTIPGGTPSSGTPDLEFEFRIAGGVPDYANEYHADTIVLTIDYINAPDTTEAFKTGPVVSDGGFVWAVTENSCGRVYLLCVNSSGIVQSHTRVTNPGTGIPYEHGLDPTAPVTLSTDSSDRAFLVLDRSVRAYETDGTLLWTHGSPATFWPGWNGSCVDPATGLVWVSNYVGATLIMEGLNPASGALSTSFDTLKGSPRFGTIFALDGSSLYLPLSTGSGSDFIEKWSTSGVQAWSADMSAIGPGFDGNVMGPSVSGTHVYAFNDHDSTSGVAGCLISLNEATGAFEWAFEDTQVGGLENYGGQTAGYDAPAVDASGQVYAPMGSLDTRALIALDPSDGSLLWTYTDAVEELSANQVPPPSIGDDGFLVLPRNNVIRLNILDGSLSGKSTAVATPFSAALTATRTYVSDNETSGTLYAFISGSEPVPPEPPATITHDQDCFSRMRRL